MKALENIYEELKVLPPAKLEIAAAVVHKIVEEWKAERNTSFDELAGCMSKVEAGQFESAIDESCEQIDSDEW